MERPIENSLDYISNLYNPYDIVKVQVYDSFTLEVKDTVKNILDDIESGLLPEDILVLTLDDRHAKDYLNFFAEELHNVGINVNNIHEDSFGVRNFQREQCITLSTIHKAKGNEAYMVYVVGVDAVFDAPKVRERNLIFTAMTRAKAWLRVSGIGINAQYYKMEVEKALEKFPRLEFIYPSYEEVTIMKRDLAAPAISKQEAERKLNELLETFSPDEVERILKQRKIKKRKNNYE